MKKAHMVFCILCCSLTLICGYGSIDAAYGRIIRCKALEHFERLPIHSSSKLIFLMRSDTLPIFKEKSGYEMLLAIGYPLDYIEHLVKEGYQFKLVVFSEEIPAQSATWTNVLTLASEAYPEVSVDLLRHKQALESLSFEHFEAAVGYRFSDIYKKGANDARYMTYERYLNSRRNLLDTRAFLYFTLRLNELFSGDGYTYDHEGNRCFQEYVIPIQALSTLGAYPFLDIEVELPAFALP